MAIWLHWFKNTNTFIEPEMENTLMIELLMDIHMSEGLK